MVMFLNKDLVIFKGIYEGSEAAKAETQAPNHMRIHSKNGKTPVNEIKKKSIISLFKKVRAPLNFNDLFGR